MSKLAITCVYHAICIPHGSTKYCTMHWWGRSTKAFIDLRKKRTDDIACGKVKESEKVRIPLLAKPKGLRATTKVAFEKVRTERKGRKGAKPVLGQSAADALREAEAGVGA